MKKKLAKRGMGRLGFAISDVGYNIIKHQVDNQRAICSLYEFEYGFHRAIQYIKEIAPEKIKKYREYKNYSAELTIRVNSQFIIKLDGCNIMVVTVVPINRKIKGYNPSARRIYVEFIGFKRFINLQKFLRYIYDMDNQKIKIIDPMGFERDLVPITFNQVIMDREQKYKIINGLKNWTSNKEEYKKHGMTHKIGILLYGKAGTGKSSIVRAISHMFHNADIYQMESANPSAIAQIASRIEESNKPIIVLLEDFDLHYPINRDNNVNALPNMPQQQPDEGAYPINYMIRPDMKYGATLALNQLLQFLDGNLSIDNTIIIATTTHLENIDPDVIRYGRFDIQIQMDYFDKVKALEYVNMFEYGEKELDEIVAEHEYPIQPSQLRYRVLEYKANHRKKGE